MGLLYTEEGLRKDDTGKVEMPASTGGWRLPAVTGQRFGPGRKLRALRANRELIAEAGRQFGARRIRVFGSAARGEETPDSDIDFLVDFPRGYDVFLQRLPLAEPSSGNHRPGDGPGARA